MAWDRLSGNQQARTDILAQINVLVRRQQRFGTAITAANGNKVGHKVVPAFGQILTPFADRTRQLTAVLIHRRFVAVVIRQAKVINLIG
ncbi:hypothetical protein D3C75_1227280 [compost metagenome]